MLIAKISYASVKNPTPVTIQTFTWNQLYHGIHSECLFPLHYQRRRVCSREVRLIDLGQSGYPRLVNDTDILKAGFIVEGR